MTASGIRGGMQPAERRVLFLLVVSIFINYIDRGNLSIAAPLLEKELSLSPSAIGALLSSFFWTYALFQLFGIAGWLVDRFDVTLVFAGGFLIWSAATAATGLMHSFEALFAMRLLLGAGESVAYPCYSKILARDFPEHHRGLANSLLDAGSKMGPALGTLIGSFLITYIGWRMFFIALGVGCLVWLLPWMQWRPRGHTNLALSYERGPSVAQILRNRSAWGSFGGLFCANYFWFFLLTWLPLYLVNERHLSIRRMGVVNSLAFVAMAIATVITGWLADRWILAGASVTRVRKTFTITGLTFSTIILPVAVVHDVNVSIWLLVLACMSFGVFTSSHWAITQTLAGPLAAGRWTSLQNGVGNLAGITAPTVTGVVVQYTGSYYLAFVASAAVVLTGACMYAFVIGPIEQVRFTAPAYAD